MGLYRAYDKRTYNGERGRLGKRSMFCSCGGHIRHRQYNIFDCEKCGQSFFYDEEDNAFRKLTYPASQLLH